MRNPIVIPAAVLVVSVICGWPAAAAEIPPIPRVLPPEGLEIPADVRARLESRLVATKKRMAGHKQHLLPDVEIFTKAVEFALLHREFYVPKDFAKADWALDEANKRLDSLDKGESPWTTATGLVVRGYRSEIDGSAQPYGVEIPEGHDFATPARCYVWLHGRGDNNTDLHFLYERATKPGQIKQPGVIVLHPFGRHCVGYKHAGEVDVMDVVGLSYGEYMLEAYRVALMGFSMGGAGAWHIGAHHADQWVAVSPGAGFAETARYQRLAPDKYPPWYEQKLWGQYDVPNYVRNLFNTETIAYSGELDKQIQAARVMEQAFRSEGRELTHLIGPGTEHKYEPATLQDLLKRMESVVDQGQEERPTRVHLQTRTLRYPTMHWVTILALEQHWEDARVDAELIEPDTIKVTTKNIAALRLSPPDFIVKTVHIDGQELPSKNATPRAFAAVVKEGDRWRADPTLDVDAWRGRLVKTWGQQGPIDDAFYDKFVVVTPSGKSKNPRFQAWVEFELAHFRNRWRALMRAELPEMRDLDVNISPAAYPGNLILWGDADSNSVIAELQISMPAKFKEGSWSFGGRQYDGNRFVPALVFPRVANGTYRGYAVLNSGLTFREGHDKTNSQQNPKLPDWAIIDITQPPDAFSPGRIHDAGFFDEEWNLKGPVKGP